MDEQKQKYLIVAVSCLGIVCVGLWVLLMVLLSGRFLGGGVIAWTTPTPTLSPPLLQPVCTPPACKGGEVYYCPGDCPGGCGTQCATPTLPPPTPPPTAPPPTMPPPTLADVVAPTDTPAPLPSPPTNTPAVIKKTPTTKVATEPPKPAFQFTHDEIKRVDGPCGVFGHIYGADGQPLEGVRVTAYSEWGWKLESPAISKPVAAPDAGYYDIILTVAPGKWTVQVIDETGLPIGNEATFVHSEGMGFCHYVIDWRRTS
jgi:hypothetical protein